MKVRLEKDPDNEYDKEAIKVTYERSRKIGYVANSSYTVIGESMSAGRLYDKIGDTAYAKVVLVTPAGTICKICKKSLKVNRRKQHGLPCDRFRNEFLEFDEYKKETSTPLEQQLYGNKPISLYRILLYLMINVNCIRRSRRNMTSSCTSMVSEV